MNLCTKCMLEASGISQGQFMYNGSSICRRHMRELRPKSEPKPEVEKEVQEEEPGLSWSDDE